ncbi:hypothetical protein BS47DRAFT_1482756 [Hydnum rufescens UP504]|uniref:Uncharacterized protein n=1 Tax=Hydnum rufescens UP504 TaxID=1448309 RepID=A0A9P6B7A1_9AGAM|nr:hypothetical protein BS47DRAFT_1482756 [Hydnum rufescens UP504]
MSDPGERSLGDISSSTPSPPPKRQTRSATRVPATLVVKPASPVSSGAAVDKGPSEFDDLIRKVWRFLSEDDLPESAAPPLLATIVQHAPDRLDQKYRDISEARKLIEGDPGILVLLRSAWKAKEFTSILDLQFLQAHQSSPPSFPRRPILLNHEIHKRGDFNVCAVHLFTYHLNQLNINRMKRDQPYSNSVAILQSSGTGKSRMVHEQSDLVFTLPFNLRPDSETKDIAHPPPDTEIRDYLDWHGPNLEAFRTRYFRLLEHLFQAVSNELARHYKTKEPNYAALARSWRKHMETGQNRARIYGGAVTACTRDDFENLLGSSSKNSPKSESEVAKILEQLLGRIDDCCESSHDIQKDHVKLMVYFDEAHILAQRKVPKDLDGKDMYDVLCSCFSFLPSSSVFVIYLSTQSNISDLTPRGSLSRSARARENPDALQAPITETPFDCSPRFPVKPGQLKLEDVYTVDFMAQFGRPLFWTLLVGAGDQRDQVRSTIVDLARSKLILNSNISQNYDTVTTTSVALDRETQLVAGHMRFAFSVPKERQYIRSGYPSEPLLAEAASRQMDEFQKRASNPSINVMAQILQSEFSSSILDQRQRGEVVFHAQSKKTIRMNPRATSAKARSFGDQILTSLPDNLRSSTTFEAAFKDAVVRFTHFGKMADDSGATTSALFAAFVRCMAIICWSSQETIDILIPVLLEPRETLKESVMTGVLIQVKRRKREGRCRIDQQALNFFPSNHKLDPRPYITLVAELGIQLPIAPEVPTKAKAKGKGRATALNPPQKKAKATKTSGFLTPPKLLISQQPKSIAHPKDVHPRYSIVAYGCSNTVYNVISDLDRPVLHFLLANRDILAEHPRLDVESLQAVRKMKPFWTAGSESYAWVAEPLLRNYEQLNGDDDGGLSIGDYDN